MKCLRHKCGFHCCTLEQSKKVESEEEAFYSIFTVKPRNRICVIVSVLVVVPEPLSVQVPRGIAARAIVSAELWLPSI